MEFGRHWEVLARMTIIFSNIGDPDSGTGIAVLKSGIFNNSETPLAPLRLIALCF